MATVYIVQDIILVGLAVERPVLLLALNRRCKNLLSCISVNVASTLGLNKKSLQFYLLVGRELNSCASFTVIENSGLTWMRNIFFKSNCELGA